MLNWAQQELEQRLMGGMATGSHPVPLLGWCVRMCASVLPQLGQPSQGPIPQNSSFLIGETEVYVGGGAGLSQDQNEQDPRAGGQSQAPGVCLCSAP